jgi:hypothetical protein
VIQLVCILILGFIILMFKILVGLCYLVVYAIVGLVKLVEGIGNRQPRQKTPGMPWPIKSMTSKEAATFGTMTSKEAAAYARKRCKNVAADQL